MTRAEAAVSALARLYPWPVEASPELDRALGFVGSTADPGAVVRAGYVAGLLWGLLAFTGLSTALDGALPAAAVALGVGLSVIHAVHRAPIALTATRRTRAVGAASDLVGRAVLRMRVEPTVERAVRFAARTGVGPLAESLTDHAERAAGTPESGLDGFVGEWGDWFGAFDRAAALIEAAADAPPGERERTLERGLDAVLDGTRAETAAFAAEIRGPATALYAFGVLLPLALVGVLPAARVAGVGVSLAHLALLYDLALPLSLSVAGAWLLVRRPVAFPPPRIGPDHPDVPARRWPALAVGACAAALGWAAATAVAAPWAGAVAAVGAGVGTALVVRFRPVAAVRDRVRAVESGLDDALYLVGRRVAEGTAVETALAQAGEEVPGATGETLADAVGVQRRLRVGVREAFLGSHGVLSDLPSPRARGAAAFLALAASEGRPAGRIVVAMADQLSELDRLEREARRELVQVTGTLANTAALFGPLVAGATVALAARMGAVDAAAGGESAGSIAVGHLGSAVGVYVLLLAAILTALSSGLDRGLDRALIGYRVGLALLAATATYLAAFVAAGLLL